MKTKLNKLTTKRFVIRKSLIGKNTVITYQHSVDNTDLLYRSPKGDRVQQYVQHSPEWCARQRRLSQCRYVTLPIIYMNLKYKL